MNQTKHALPDVTSHSKNHASQSLNWVGMERIGLPIKFKLDNGEVAAVNALTDIFVSLDADVKGIHMSRLYLKLNEQLGNQVITCDCLEQLLDRVLQSHQGISDSAMLKLSFELPLNKKALKSDKSGYQLYPIVIMHQRIKGQSETWVELTIPYSSTCPCSASLATALIGESIAAQFPQETVSKTELLQWLRDDKTTLATPHNQRSYAYIKMHMSQSHWENLEQLVLQFEEVLGTPVQTAVKREDEQEFARINGNNLMFCEDAARRIKGFLDSCTFISDYWFKVEHQESLHAHNAVVIDQKNRIVNTAQK